MLYNKELEELSGEAKEIEDQKQNDQPRRNAAHHLCLGQKALASLDGLVNLACKVHLEIARRFFVFQ